MCEKNCNKLALWFIPLLSVSAACVLTTSKAKIKPKLPRGLTGDFDFNLFSFIGCIVPLIVMFSFYVQSKLISKSDRRGDVSYISGLVANRLGFLSFFAMTFFLIPVAKHGPILSVLGWVRTPLFLYFRHFWLTHFIV